MTPLLLFIAALFILGLVPVVNGIRNAPEGVEDSSGFNIVWRNNSPEFLDVSCVWVIASSEPAGDRDDHFARDSAAQQVAPVAASSFRAGRFCRWRPDTAWFP